MKSGLLLLAIIGICLLQKFAESYRYPSSECVLQLNQFLFCTILYEEVKAHFHSDKFSEWTEFYTMRCLYIIYILFKFKSDSFSRKQKIFQSARKVEGSLGR